MAVVVVNLLAAVGAPWILELRATARAQTCRDHLQTLTVALREYHEQYRSLPPAAVWSTDATLSLALDKSKRIDLITRENWTQLILPFTEEQALAGRFDHTAAIGADANREARLTSVTLLNCPDDVYNHADNPYRFTPTDDDSFVIEFARGNYGINGGTHAQKLSPPSTRGPDGDHLHLVTTESPRYYGKWGNGIAGINKCFRFEEFQNGQSTLVAINELRAGLVPVDPRGVWSLGQIGGSITWAHGVNSDAYGPNRLWPRSDDSLGCERVHEALGPETLMAEGMPCVHYVDQNDQVASRSLHPEGVNLSFVDGSARFISNSIDTGLWHVMHSRETPAAILATGFEEALEASNFDEASPPAPARADAAREESAELLDNSVGMQLRRIPAGEFVMGVMDLGNDGETLEGAPPHKVRISRMFYLSTHEVTRGQFRQVLGHDPAAASTASDEVERAADFPVVSVTWDDAAEFCRKLSEMEPGRTYRLPTEAEWEYCCRSGSSEPYDWAAKQERTGSDSSGEAAGVDPPLPLTPVGSYPPNAFGLYDLRGNAWEWTADWFDRDYYARSPAENPRGPSQGYFKVVRGGDWRYVGETCRIDYPMLPPWKPNEFVGFRVACDIAGEPPQATAADHQ
ncbi:MAG: SUMF1/EgtB/PvdO family nonheme iron enzyme [Planctomycetaceae bacterium]